jgi:GNAT superfamily N-acetyltransferase
MIRQYATIAPKQAKTGFVKAVPTGQTIRLTNADTADVLAFLKVRPVHTVVMTSFINDNGIESELNRGTFFGYRGKDGKLEGVALIGHSTLVEARTDDALHALAIQASRSTTPIHLIMSSGDDANRFWSYTGKVEAPRLTCTEALFEVGFPYPVTRTERKVRTATMEWLMPVAEAQAEVAFFECGVDPLERDREGFLKRVARRVEQGRVFIVTEGDRMVFKADIIAETDETIYLEGIYVADEFRGRGIGSECLAALTLELLSRVEHISMLSSVELEAAHRSFIKAGYRNTDHCTTLFV